MQNDSAKLKNYQKVMKNVSLQKIEDFYLNLGYHGEDLRKALLKDEEYRRLLKRKKATLTTQSKASASDKRKYVLSVDADFEILAKCKKAESLIITKDDRLIIKLIKSQLESEWRQPLLEQIRRILKKYQK